MQRHQSLFLLGVVAACHLFSHSTVAVSVDAWCDNSLRIRATPMGTQPRDDLPGALEGLCASNEHNLVAKVRPDGAGLTLSRVSDGRALASLSWTFGSVVVDPVFQLRTLTLNVTGGAGAKIFGLGQVSARASSRHLLVMDASHVSCVGPPDAFRTL